MLEASVDQLDAPATWPGEWTRPALSAALVSVRESLQPAPAPAIAAEIEYLLLCYPNWRPVTGPGVSARQALDWVQALAAWPQDVLEGACWRWRCGEIAHPRPPSVPSELKPYGAPVLAARRALEWRLARCVAAAHAAAQKSADAKAPIDKAALDELLRRLRAKGVRMIEFDARPRGTIPEKAAEKAKVRETIRIRLIEGGKS
jgi:hypothetical protein